jgi:arylsulfatase A-like enzyme
MCQTLRNMKFKKTISIPKILFCASLVFIFSSGSHSFHRNRAKPNIIFILTDDQRWDAIGYAGNKVIQTPEMDRLSKEGVYFKNSFVTTPICAASRASILTAMQERTTGYSFGQGNIQDRYMQISYPMQMKNSGYYTGFYGKFGVRYEQVDRLFHESEVYDRNENFKDRRGYYFKKLGQDTVHLTRYTGQKAIDFIRKVPAETPFCLSLSFSAPHAHDPSPDQYYWNNDSDTLYRQVYIDPPVMAEDQYFMDQPDYVRKGENRNRWHWRFDTPAKYQASVKGYFRMISDIDSELGKIRAALQEKKMDQNTIIILMGDNGYFLGERQLAGKWLMYENSLRVPLIIYDPRAARHRDIEDIALNIDIAPTIFEFAGLKIPTAWQGKSLMAYVNGKNPVKSREGFVCEHLWEAKTIPPSEGFRTKEWKYFRYLQDKQHEELYYLVDDKLEKYNLASDPNHFQRLQKMRMNCDKIISELRNQKLPDP